MNKAQDSITAIEEFFPGTESCSYKYTGMQNTPMLSGRELIKVKHNILLLQV